MYNLILIRGGKNSNFKFEFDKIVRVLIFLNPNLNILFKPNIELIKVILGLNKVRI